MAQMGVECLEDCQEWAEAEASIPGMPGMPGMGGRAARRRMARMGGAGACLGSGMPDMGGMMPPSLQSSIPEGRPRVDARRKAKAKAERAAR